MSPHQMDSTSFDELGVTTDTETLQRIDELHERARRAVRAAREARDRGVSAARVNELISRLEKAVDEVGGLHTAMRTRATIEQAKGIVMCLFRCGEEEAFARLVRMSQASQLKVNEVAARLVAQVSDGEAVLADAPPG